LAAKLSNHYIQEDAPEAIAAAVERVDARLLKRVG